MVISVVYRDVYKKQDYLSGENLEEIKGRFRQYFGKEVENIIKVEILDAIKKPKKVSPEEWEKWLI